MIEAQPIRYGLMPHGVYRDNFFFLLCCHRVIPFEKTTTSRQNVLQNTRKKVWWQFDLLLDALVLMLARQMPFAAAARIVGESWHRVCAICAKYVELAMDAADSSVATIS